jgi:hypothetical protein
MPHLQKSAVIRDFFRRPWVNSLHTSPEVTVLNPSDLLGKEKTCFSQKRYGRVID